MAMADAEIKNMEAAVAVAEKQLAGLSGEAAEQVSGALRKLTEKLAVARARRAAIEKRAARVQRMAEVTQALSQIRAELEPLIASGDRGPRFDALRERARSLQEEAVRLKATA